MSIDCGLKNLFNRQPREGVCVGGPRRDSFAHPGLPRIALRLVELRIRYLEVGVNLLKVPREVAKNAVFKIVSTSA